MLPVDAAAGGGTGTSQKLMPSTALHLLYNGVIQAHGHDTSKTGTGKTAKRQILVLLKGTASGIP